MSTHEATVEVLTAEVRVLMVGSRQVTLSVFGQLDTVDVGEVDLIGRVRPKDANIDYLYLIGRHRGTGALVRSVVPGGPESIMQELDWGEYAHAIARTEHEARLRYAEVERIENYETQVHHTNHRCDADEALNVRAKALAADAEAQRLLAEYQGARQPLLVQARELSELPLIVLAGLR